jgi:hypothetical protein
VMVTLRGAASRNGRASSRSTRFGNRMIILTLHARPPLHAITGYSFCNWRILNWL